MRLVLWEDWFGLVGYASCHRHAVAVRGPQLAVASHRLVGRLAIALLQQHCHCDDPCPALACLAVHSCDVCGTFCEEVLHAGAEGAHHLKGGGVMVVEGPEFDPVVEDGRVVDALGAEVDDEV